MFSTVLICIQFTYTRAMLSILYINIEKGCNFSAKQLENTQKNSFERSSCSPLCNQIRIKRKLDNFKFSEYTYRSESQEETILRQHFGSLFVVLLCVFFFFTTSAASYLGTDFTDLSAIMSEMSPLPTSQSCFCAIAMNNHPCLFRHK